MSAANDQTRESGAASAAIAELGYKQELKRSLSAFDLLVYGLVFIAPVGPWPAFGFVFNISRGMVPLVYSVGLVAMMFTALSYQTMAKAFPVAGSVYAYAGRGIGPAAGFLAGWALLLDYLLFPALIYVISAVTLHAVLPAIPKAVFLIVLLAANTAINLYGIESTARLSRILLVLQMLLLALFCAFAIVGVMRGVNGAHLAITPFYDARSFTPGIVFGALSLAVLSFLGFDGISTLAEEAKGGARAVGIATVQTLLLAAALFIVQTYLASLFVLGRGPFADGDEAATAFYAIAGAIGGETFRYILSICGVLFAGQAAALAAQAATARLVYSMARDAVLPRSLAHIDPRTGAPNRAIMLACVVTLVLGIALVDQLELLTSMVNFGALTGFLALHLSVVWHFIVRQRSRRWVHHLIVPIFGFAIVGYVLFNAQTMAKITGLCWFAMGVIVLIVVRMRGKSATTFLNDDA